MTEEEKMQASKGLSSGDIQYCLHMTTSPPKYPWLDRLRASMRSDEEFLTIVKNLKRPSQEIWNRCNYLCRLDILKIVNVQSDSPTKKRQHNIHYQLGPSANIDPRALWRLRKRLRAARAEDAYSNGTVALIGLDDWNKIPQHRRDQLFEQMEEIATSIAYEVGGPRILKEKRDFPLIVIDPEYAGSSILPIWLEEKSRRVWELKKRLEKTKET